MEDKFLRSRDGRLTDGFEILVDFRHVVGHFTDERGLSLHVVVDILQFVIAELLVLCAQVILAVRECLDHLFKFLIDVFELLVLPLAQSLSVVLIIGLELIELLQFGGETSLEPDSSISEQLY